MLGEDVEDLWSPGGMWTVVKGEIDDTCRSRRRRYALEPEGADEKRSHLGARYEVPRTEESGPLGVTTLGDTGAPERGNCLGVNFADVGKGRGSVAGKAKAR